MLIDRRLHHRRRLRLLLVEAEVAAEKRQPLNQNRKRRKKRRIWNSTCLIKERAGGSRIFHVSLMPQSLICIVHILVKREGKVESNLSGSTD